MRDNLHFHDIPNVDSEDCMQTVRQFMCDNTHVRKKINIQRVHRIRRNSTNSNAPYSRTLKIRVSEKAGSKNAEGNRLHCR